MTVRELIALLEQHDGDQHVLVNGYEDGYEDPEVGTVEVYHAPRVAWWSGDYQRARYNRPRPDTPTFDAVVISR